MRYRVYDIDHDVDLGETDDLPAVLHALDSKRSEATSRDLSRWVISDLVRLADSGEDFSDEADALGVQVTRVGGG